MLQTLDINELLSADCAGRSGIMCASLKLTKDPNVISLKELFYVPGPIVRCSHALSGPSMAETSPHHRCALRTYYGGGLT